MSFKGKIGQENNNSSRSWEALLLFLVNRVLADDELAVHTYLLVDERLKAFTFLIVHAVVLSLSNLEKSK